MPASNALFSSRFGFLMAAIGFAVGLGNIWRFPYLTGENGGGAFVLMYLLCVLLIGVPIIMAELLIGRRGRLSPPGSLAAIAVTEKVSLCWRWLGNLNVLAAFLIVGVYAVIVGWVLRYLYLAGMGRFAAMTAGSASDLFAATRADTSAMLLWTLLGLMLTGAIIVGGVQQGIERAVRVLMPMLFGLLVLLAIYNVFAGGMAAAINYLFVPDFSLVTPSLLLVVVGQAFFSIGVAMAARCLASRPRCTACMRVAAAFDFIWWTRSSSSRTCSAAFSRTCALAWLGSNAKGLWERRSCFEAIFSCHQSGCVLLTQPQKARDTSAICKNTSGHVGSIVLRNSQLVTFLRKTTLHWNR